MKRRCGGGGNNDILVTINNNMQCEAIVLELVSVGELVCVRLTMNGGGGVCVCANIGGYSIIHPHYSVWICV